MSAHPNYTITEGYAARDRLIARARQQAFIVRCVVCGALIGAGTEVARCEQCRDDEPQDLGGTRIGYPDGASYDPAANVTEQAWFRGEPDRDARRAAYRKRCQAMFAYSYLIRRAGRGLTVAHLADARGNAVCGRRLGEEWDLVKTTERQICGRCLKNIQAAEVI